MVSTGESPPRRFASVLGVLAPIVAGALFGGMAPGAVGAQSLAALGLRGGAGFDGAGNQVYDGQIDLTDLSGSTAVEVAIRGFGEGVLSKDYQSERASRAWDNHEEMRAWGVAIMADFLFHHSRGVRGPYVMVGLGAGPLWFRWRLDSTDPRLGDPLPDGGSFLEEEGTTLGSLLGLGLGQRLHDHLDMRAVATAVLVPSTDLREDLAIVPLFSLTVGVRL